MKLFSYYKKAVIYPSLFILLFCILSSIIDNLLYKSEWSTAKTEILMTIITSFIFSFLMCVLSLTIFLNRFKKLHSSLIWNIASWFLLPIAYITIVLTYAIQSRIKYEFGFGSDFIYLLFMTLPFVIGLYWTFMKYRKAIAASVV